MDDLVEGLIRLMNSREQLTGPMNLGNPGEFTIRELAEKVIEMTANPKTQLLYDKISSCLKLIEEKMAA